MHNLLGYSVYLSTFEKQKEHLLTSANTGATVFLSLHISEEFSEDYCKQIEEICRWLYERKYKIIADISPKTAEQFGEPDLIQLAEKLGIWGFRVDYGFSIEQICRLASRMPVVVNASTTSAEDAARIVAAGTNVMAMHNFYPRPETGLDEYFMQKSTTSLQNAGLKVLAFISGDKDMRGPIYAGLPTMERHRKLPPSVAYMELITKFHVDGVFVGDPTISIQEQKRIMRYCCDGIVEIPVMLDDEYSEIFGRVFTSRPDSPMRCIRFAESREYACFGTEIQPKNCIDRQRGNITIDNITYGRYSGEIQLLRLEAPADSRVNVIGKIKDSWIDLVDSIPNGQKFILTST